MPHGHCLNTHSTPAAIGGAFQLNTLFNTLPDPLQHHLDSIKTALENILPFQSSNSLTNCLGNWLLDDEQQQILGLNPWNIFFLALAARLLEAGISQNPDVLNLPGSNQENEKLNTFFEEQITHNWRKLGLDDSEQARIIMLILSEIENTAAGIDPSDNTEHIQYKNTPVNIALLSGAVGLAAELNPGQPAIAQKIARALPCTEHLSTEQFCKYFSVSSSGPHDFLPGTIRIGIHCRHPEVHRALKHHETRIQRLLHSLNNQVSPRFLFSDIIFEITPSGYKPLDMKFSVDSMAALRLFTGNRLYSDHRVFLRELVQNAVDACNLKKLFNEDHAPEISIEFDDKNRVIRFQDNGIGMDRQWIEKYFLKIGISFYQSGDLKTMNKNRVDFNFISKFGIGFLSSFLVSDKIIIQTRKNDSPGLVITITNLQDYFDVRFIPKDCPEGTRVPLHLRPSKNNYSRNMDYICYLKTNVRYLSIPVTLLDHEGRQTTLGHEKLAYQTDKGSGRDFLTILEFQDAEGYLFLKAKQNLHCLYGLEPASGGVSIFQDGIFITQTNSLLPEGARKNIIGRINLTGKDRCELSMDRNRIFWTARQLNMIKRTIRLGIVDLVNQLLEDMLKHPPPAATKQSLINNLAVFFDFNEMDDEMFNRLEQPIRKITAKRFRDFIRVNFAHTQKQQQIPEADGYGEKWQQQILETFAEKSRPSLPDI